MIEETKINLQRLKLSGTTLIILACALAIFAGSAVGTAIWSGTVSWPAPIALPTDTFTVAATFNGQAVATPANINIPTPAYIGNSYIIIYTITSTANQPITVSETNTITGGTPTWDKTSVSLAVGGSDTMTLTLSALTGAGHINVSFAASP